MPLTKKESLDNERINFGKKIQEFRKSEGLTQEQFIRKLNYSSQASLSRIERGEFYPELMFLLKLRDTFGEKIIYRLLDLNSLDRVAGSQWNKSIPSCLTPKQAIEVDFGIEVFNKMMNDNLDTDAIYHNLRDHEFIRNIIGNANYSKSMCEQALSNAISSKFIYLESVRTLDKDEKTLRQIKAAFPHLKELKIVDVPVEGEKSKYATIIVVELVAFVASKIFDTLMHQNKIIALGSGYTLYRMASLAVPRINFPEVKWISLQGININSIYSANHITSSLFHKYSGCLSLAESDSSVRIDSSLTLDDGLTNVFITANGIGGRPEAPALLMNARGKVLEHAVTQYEKIINENKNHNIDDRIIGECLGFFIEEHGNNIPMKEHVCINFSVLNDLVKRGDTVWLVAAKRYKAEIIYTLLCNKYINALVIDKELAVNLVRFISSHS